MQILMIIPLVFLKIKSYTVQVNLTFTGKILFALNNINI